MSPEELQKQIDDLQRQLALEAGENLEQEQFKKLSKYKQSESVVSTGAEGVKLKQPSIVEEQLQQRIKELEEKHRWIPVSERLPEEKDAVEIYGVKRVETLVWDVYCKWWDTELISWDSEWIKENALYWRTPSQYPEPPKTEL